MITTQTPIGEIINYIHRNSDSYENSHVFSKIEKLIDLIIIRTGKNGVHHSLDSLLDDIFKLRFEIINKPELIDSIFSDLNNHLEERIQQQFNKSTKYRELEQAFVNSINIYRQIADSILSKISDGPFVSIKSLSTYQYEDVVNFLNSLPGRESQFILSYIKSSLALDYAFIVSELIFDNELKLKNSEIENLRLLLKNSIEEFGVYSSIFQLWTPEESDESQWIRNIKIRISAFDSMSLSDKFSSDELQKYFAA